METACVTIGNCTEKIRLERRSQERRIVVPREICGAIMDRGIGLK